MYYPFHCNESVVKIQHLQGLGTNPASHPARQKRQSIKTGPPITIEDPILSEFNS